MISFDLFLSRRKKRCNEVRTQTGKDYKARGDDKQVSKRARARAGGCGMKMGVSGYEERMKRPKKPTRGTNGLDTKGYAASDDSNNEGRRSRRREVGANEWECGKEEAIRSVH